MAGDPVEADVRDVDGLDPEHSEGPAHERPRSERLARRWLRGGVRLADRERRRVADVGVHTAGLPAVADPVTFTAMVMEFRVDELSLVVEPDAAEAVRASLDASGLLLLGEMHGVRENPQIVFALMREFGIGGLALEWPASAERSVAAWRGGEPLPDDRVLWYGDGRVTAGHYALLKARPGDVELAVTLFDLAAMPAGGTWSTRDAAMAAAVLRAPRADRGVLVVAGNFHTMLTAIEWGEPMGLHLARARPGVRSVDMRYRSGGFYNGGPRRFSPDNAHVAAWATYGSDSQTA